MPARPGSWGSSGRRMAWSRGSTTHQTPGLCQGQGQPPSPVGPWVGPRQPRPFGHWFGGLASPAPSPTASSGWPVPGPAGHTGVPGGLPDLAAQGGRPGTRIAGCLWWTCARSSGQRGFASGLLRLPKSPWGGTRSPNAKRDTSRGTWPAPLVCARQSLPSQSWAPREPWTRQAARAQGAQGTASCPLLVPNAGLAQAELQTARRSRRGQRDGARPLTARRVGPDSHLKPPPGL